MNIEGIELEDIIMEKVYAVPKNNNTLLKEKMFKRSRILLFAETILKMACQERQILLWLLRSPSDLIIGNESSTKIIS